MLMNTGFDKVISKSGLLSTIAWQIDGKVTYALEGSVFMAGAVLKWLRDDLNLISSAAESEKIAQSLPDNEGVYFVPAFAGLAAPYWDTEAKGIICGLKTGCGKAHIVRAALEAMAFQSRDVILCMEKDSSLSLKELHVDGGAAENNFLLQFQADILGNSVIRPAQVETTVLGAGMLAAKAVDFEFNSSQIQNSIFLPEINSDKRFSLCEEWKNAINKART
jgi:glycerol kinase